MESIKNVAMYLRKSRAEELNDTVEETLKKHKETLLEFALNNDLNIKKEDIYEEVISGESLYSRPEMIRLLSNVESGKFDAVLCMDIDRLGRGSMSDQGIILETFKNSDTKIITPRKIYDLNNDLDETYSEFESFMARQELKTIKRRLQRGKKKTIEDGGYASNAPYGYFKTNIKRKPTLIINEEEAQYVRMIFDMYVNQGKGCQIIADTLNSMGAKPHRSDEFGRTSIRKILRNYTYIGKIVWNQRICQKQNGQNVRVYNPRENWTIFDGLHPAIIDEDTFYKAQEIRQSRYHAPSNTGVVVNPLSGIVFCSCGNLMQRQKTKNDEVYLICINKKCKVVSSRLEYVEKAVLDGIKNELEQLSSKLKDKDIKQYYDYVLALKNVEAEIKTVEHQKAKLHDLLEQEVYDIDTFLSRQNVLSQKEIKLEDAKKMLIDKTTRGRLDTETMRKNLKSVLESYSSANAQEKNMLLKSILEKAVYHKINLL